MARGCRRVRRARHRTVVSHWRKKAARGKGLVGPARLLTHGDYVLHAQVIAQRYTGGYNYSPEPPTRTAPIAQRSAKTTHEPARRAPTFDEVRRITRDEEPRRNFGPPKKPWRERKPAPKRQPAR